jgi:hypothetical protein
MTTKSVPFTDIERVGELPPQPPQYLENVRTLQVGFGSKVLRADQRGIWLGGEDPTTAPFSVDMDGNMIANSVTLTGYIAVGGALSDIGSGNITSTYIGSSAITTSKIQSNAVTASKISVSELSAITADIGSVTSGTITGALIRTSSSGDRVELDDGDDAIRIYDTGGNKRMELIHDTLNFYDSNEVNNGLIYATTTASYAYLYFDISNNSDGSFLFNIDNTGRFIIGEDGNTALYYEAVDNEWVFWEDIVSDGGIVDIGSSAADFDDIWCDELHYNTLTLRSDRRVKENIKPISYGLDAVLKLDPVSFNFKKRQRNVRAEAMGGKPALRGKKKKIAEDKLKAKKKRAEDRAVHKHTMPHMGFIAQDVAKIIPEITENAHEDSEAGTAAIRQQEMTAILVKAVQELHAELEAVKKAR